MESLNKVGEAFQQGGCVRSVENGPRKGPQRPMVRLKEAYLTHGFDREKPRESEVDQLRGESVFKKGLLKKNLQSIYKMSCLECRGPEEPYSHDGGGAPLENWEMAMSITGHSSKTCSSKGKKLAEHLGETDRDGNKQDPEKKIDGGPLD